MKLVIFYLTSDSRHYTFPHFISLLDKSDKKNQWKLLVLTNSEDTEFYEGALITSSINHQVVKIQTDNNYMDKVKFAIEYSHTNNIPYMMKCDNDIFLTHKTLDYMIENLSVLDGKEHLTLGPTLSSGIPGIEYFKRQFLSADERDILDTHFSETHFRNMDDAEYAQLNVYTYGSDSWNGENFFQGVKAFNHHYKGIHPIRVNFKAISYLNECILNNKACFFDAQPSSLIKNDSSPYLCNSIFCIRTDIYNKIINDPSLFVDQFDEVPLNKYANRESMNHVFVENGFAIHILYNWFKNLTTYELDFTNKLFSHLTVEPHTIR
jgi:hypothetical protein